jgi:hypothetical protein
MKKILLFESFIQKLNELDFTAHWKERSSLPTEDNSSQSRIQEFSEKTKHGWTLDGLIDSRRNKVDIDKFLENTYLDKESLRKEIVKALRVLTRGGYLERWKDNSGPAIQLLDLGKIGVYNGEKTVYPLLKTRSEEKGVSYEPAEGVWGVADRNVGITFMYFPATKQGAELFYTQAKRTSKLRDLDFLQSSGFVFPYGEGFRLIIDATDPVEVSRSLKLEKQVRGEEITYGPEPEKEYVSTPIIEPQRKTFSPGDKIGVIVKYVSGTIPTLGRIKEILNIEEIKKAQKGKNLDKIKEIKIKFVPELEKDRRYGSNGEVLAVPIILTENTIVTINGINYKILGPSKNKPLVTPEPSIINSGGVQSWVEETNL